MSRIHDVFHVSVLCKEEIDTSCIIPSMPIEIREDLTVEMKPIKILDQSFKELRSKIFVRKGECKP